MTKTMLPATLILLLGYVASASTLTADAGASVTGTICTSSTNCTQFTDVGSQTGSPASVQVLDVWGVTRANASASFGGIAIDTYANTGAPNFSTCLPQFGFPCAGQPFPQYDLFSSGANADAGFSDTVHTFGGAGVANFVATLSVLFDVPNPHQGSVMAGVQIGSAGFSCAPGRCMTTTTVSGQIPLTGTFVIAMNGSANIFDSAPDDPQNGSSGSGITISIQSINLTDAQGNPITGLHYYSDSGTAYLLGQTFVPEPSAATLIGLGLVAVVARYRWREYPGIRMMVGRYPAWISGRG